MCNSKYIMCGYEDIFSLASLYGGIMASDLKGFVFGVKALDWCVERVDPRSMIAIVGPSGGGKSLLVRNIASYHLAKGGYVIYLALDDDPLHVVTSLSSLIGEDAARSSISSGRLRIIDGFSYRMSPLKPSLDIIARSLQSLSMDEILSATRVEASYVSEKGGRGVMIIDSYNEILSSGEISGATELIKRIRAIVSKGYGITSLVVVHTDSEEIAGWLKTIENTLDGVVVANIEMDIMKKKVSRYLYIKKMRFVAHCIEPIEYKVEKGRIVV
jgi:KaiC/GvpD/RAD55 family RecA-like ATPase